jgi:hypothetical protein
VRFVEAPTVPYPANLDWVEFEQPQDHRLFRAIAHDAKLPSAPAAPAPATSPAATPTPPAGHKVAGLSSKYGGIDGTANCRSDAGAFAGPLSP